MDNDRTVDAVRRTAVHEAGHAMMACICGIPFCEVTIEPMAEHGALVCVIADKGKPLAQQWQFDASDHKRYMLMVAAGAAAELAEYGEQFTHQDYVGVTNDTTQLMSIAKRIVPEAEADAYAASMIREARELLRPHLVALGLVSDTLMKNTRLDRQRVIELIEEAKGTT